ncbi:endonuclease III domain-containing protein [Candidatus Mancarchaeum acidiphilum]|nr:endonuclease III [Candidatus Mancarchaeum acidiphilum]
MEMVNDKKFNEIVSILENKYKNVGYYLNFKTPIDLLVAAILSPQTRDTTINKLTPKLFENYHTAADYAHADKAELLSYISSVTFANPKAERIIEACRIVDEKYGGRVPDEKEDLLKLPGIGEKTAVTILINAYGKVEGIPVDTWVIKLSERIGLADSKNPDKIEEELKSKIDKKYWHNFAYILKEHGKELCGSIPHCSKCPLNGICPKNGVTKSL